MILAGVKNRVRGQPTARRKQQPEKQCWGEGERLNQIFPIPTGLSGQTNPGLSEARTETAAILDCGGKRSATPLWPAAPPDSRVEKRRRRSALPAQSMTFRAGRALDKMTGPNC